MTEDQVLLEEGKYCVALDETDKKELIVLKCIEEAEAEARFVLFPIGNLNYHDNFKLCNCSPESNLNEEQINCKNKQKKYFFNQQSTFEL